MPSVAASAPCELPPATSGPLSLDSPFLVRLRRGRAPPAGALRLGVVELGVVGLGVVVGVVGAPWVAAASLGPVVFTASSRMRRARPYVIWALRTV